MVTTIKITCDGVFIQSNSFLTNSHHQAHHHSNEIRQVLIREANNSNSNSNNDNSINDSNDNNRFNDMVLKTQGNGFNCDEILDQAANDGDLRIVIRNQRKSINQSQDLMLKNCNNNSDKEEQKLSPDNVPEEESIYNKIVLRDKKKYQFCGPIKDYEEQDFLPRKSENNLERRLSHNAVYRPPQHYMYLVRKVTSATKELNQHQLLAKTKSHAQEEINKNKNNHLLLSKSPSSPVITTERLSKASQSINKAAAVSNIDDQQCLTRPLSHQGAVVVQGEEEEKEEEALVKSFCGPQSQHKYLVEVRQTGEEGANSANNNSSTSCEVVEIRQQQQHQQLTGNHKRARRNSTGQIAIQLGGGMNSHTAALNLQSAGQTAVVGHHHRGFPQVSANTAASLEATANNNNNNNNSTGRSKNLIYNQPGGECLWLPQNPSALSSVMPPTAPARQHKRPAPQPGQQYQPQHSSTANLNPVIAQANLHMASNPLNSQNSSLHHLQHPLISSQIPTTISDLHKPNSIPIQPHPNSQHSPKSPNQQQPCQPSAGILGPPPTSLMSTSLNSQLTGHGLQAQQSMVPNLNAANSQSSLHQSSNPSSTQQQQQGGGGGGGGNHIAMSTSLHGGSAVNLGHPAAAVAGSNCLGVNLTSNLSSNLSSVSSSSLYMDSSNPAAVAAVSAALWSSSTPPPLLQRKCEVKLNAMPWFHGSISRDEAEHLLQPRDDGLFLVRESTNFPGDYTLCVCYQGKVEHYRVKYLDNKLTIDDEEYFENLGQLVQHYEKDADGLCTQLIKCLPKKGRQEFCINSKDFLDKGWVIPEADLQLRESIGKGEFGDVMLGILRNDKVAVKVLKDEGAAQKFLTEASVMTTLEHENLVKFIGLVFTSKHIYLVTEYMSKGSLVDYLRSRGRQHITRKDQINFACDTCSGMEYLEAKKVVHRDLAARNVLISENCIAKVADFGLAREECYNLDVGKLPIKWTAPEALKGGRFSNKSDMWSFGILLWEIYSFGRVPYPRIPLADVVKHVEVGYKMEAPEGCPTEIYEMMRQAWDLNPARRPTFAELKIKLLQLKIATT